MTRRRAPLTVLIPDGEGQWALRVMRSIADARSVRCHVISPWADDISRYSRYCGSYRLRPADMPASDRVALICRIAREVRADVILPSSIDGIAFCSRYLEELSEAAPLPPLPEPEAMVTVNDKGLLAQALRERGVPQPETALLARSHADPGALTAFPFPALIKPRVSAGGRGIRRVECQADLSDHMDCLEGEHILQAIVDGEDVGCSLLADRGVVIALTTQRAVLKSREPYAPPVGVDVEPIAGAEESGRRFVSQMKWSGLANIDMRLDADGVAHILDVNPRFWGSTLASTAAGANFAYIACLTALGEPVDTIQMRPTRFMGSRVALAQLGMRVLGRSAVLPRSIRGTWAPFILRDPLPNVIGRLRQLRRIART